jgi:hypothetical protein
MAEQIMKRVIIWAYTMGKSAAGKFVDYKDFY